MDWTAINIWLTALLFKLQEYFHEIFKDDGRRNTDDYDKL